MAPEDCSERAPCVQHAIRIRQTGEVYLCAESETLLQAMARIGRKGIPAGCLNGGCGVCKISVRAGRVRRVGPMSRAHVSEGDEADGVCLACRVAPVGAVEVEVIGRLQKALGFPWGPHATSRAAPPLRYDETKET